MFWCLTTLLVCSVPPNSGAPSVACMSWKVQEDQDLNEQVSPLLLYIRRYDLTATPLTKARVYYAQLVKSKLRGKHMEMTGLISHMVLFPPSPPLRVSLY